MRQQDSQANVPKREKYSKDQRNGEGSRVRGWVQQTVADIDENRWLDDNVPTVPPEEPAQVNCKPTQNQ